MYNTCCLDFTKSNFLKLVGDETAQTRYLYQFLRDIKVSSIISEKHYIDRYYMEEFENYYASCFKNLKNYCQRLHFFSKKVSEQLFDNAMSGDDKSIKILQEEYRGYIVLRPLQTIKIGRTVLSPYFDKDSREFIKREYDVHLSGICLKIKTLASQQQDRGVSACATTAIWSSLQKLCKDNGSKPPGPFTISKSAVRYSIPTGRGFPQTGLTSEQMHQAISNSGFTPISINCGNQTFGQFKSLLNSYLQSNIPPILVLFSLSPEEGHAVTVTGRSITGNHCLFADSIEVRDFNKVYIHDDRLGPYVRTILEEKVFTPTELDVAKSLGFYSDKSPSIKIEGEEWLISEMIVPLYPKIRATIYDFYELSVSYLQFMHRIMNLNYNFIIDISLCMGGDYLNTIVKDKDLNKAKKIKFLKDARLSRYVGITEVFDNKRKKLFSIIWDTTDIPRHKIDNFLEFANNSILGMVIYDESFGTLFRGIWSSLKINSMIL